MNRLPQFLGIALIATGCFDKPPFLTSGTASLSQGSDPVAVATIDQDGGTTGLISASAGGAQILTAGSASGVEGSTISFPPGALSIDTNITVTEGEQLATNGDVTSALGLDADSVSSAGAPVAILSEAKIDAATPFAVALAVPSAASLRSETSYSHAILFKVFHAFENKYVVGLIPSTEVTVADGFVTFATKYFGVYQVIVTTRPTLTAVAIETKEAVKTKAQVETASTKTSTSTSSSTGTSSSTSTSTAKSDTPGTDGASDSADAGDDGDAGTTDGEVASSNVRVTSVTSPSANGNYYPGDDLTIEVQFSGPVTLPAGTTLALLLNSGISREAVSTASVAGSDLITLHYAIGPGDTTTDLDYSSADALIIKAGDPPLDAAGQTFSLELPSPGTTGSLGASKAISIPLLATRSASLSTFSSGISGRAIPAMVWDDAADRVLIWGGWNAPNFNMLGDGARISAGGAATAMTASGAPSARYGMAATWTGSDLFIWGGGGQADGALYNSGADTWSPLSSSGLSLSGRSWATAVMDVTNSRVLVWGGYDSGNLDDGQVYDLAGSWDTFDDTTRPAARAHHKAVFVSSNSRMYVFGGHTGDLSGSLSGGAKYLHDCGADCWLALPSTNEPTPRVGHVMVSTGSKVIVWGGFNSVSSGLADGGIYDTSSGTWDPIPVTTGIRGRHDAAAVWDAANNVMIVYGGEDGSHTYDTAMAFNPTDMTWKILDFGSTKIEGSALAGAAYGNGNAYFFGGTVGVIGSGGTFLDRVLKITLGNGS